MYWSEATMFMPQAVSVSWLPLKRSRPGAIDITPCRIATSGLSPTGTVPVRQIWVMSSENARRIRWSMLTRRES